MMAFVEDEPMVLNLFRQTPKKRVLSLLGSYSVYLFRYELDKLKFQDALRLEIEDESYSWLKGGDLATLIDLMVTSGFFWRKKNFTDQAKMGWQTVTVTPE